MNYIEFLHSSAVKHKSIVCLGLDPVLEKIPLDEASVRTKITVFFEKILNEIVRKNIYPSAVKPNYAFYAQYAFEGLHALKDVIDIYKQADIPVILDSKRGDIGATSEAYARETFSFFSSDAVTLSPYMGIDSIKPFFDQFPDKGYYLLCRTSNKSAEDFQNCIVDGDPLFIKVAKKICEWNIPTMGAVVGATYPAELEQIIALFNSYGLKVPLLIPGIGTQGGDLSVTISALKKTASFYINRINSSSGILYSYQKKKILFDHSAVEEIEKLNSEIERLYSI